MNSISNTHTISFSRRYELHEYFSNRHVIYLSCDLCSPPMRLCLLGICLSV